MPPCFFVSDLHGCTEKYEKLLCCIRSERPSAVFLGGDLLSGTVDLINGYRDFADEYFVPRFNSLHTELGDAYPSVFLILGNDDPRCSESKFLRTETDALWQYMHQRQAKFADFDVYGYNCVPPTPFLLKDWERYDLSRYVDPGCVSPEEGYRTVPADAGDTKWGSIEKDLAGLASGNDLEGAILLLHAPPHDTPLDRADLEGKSCDHVPLDCHVGSIAVRRLIEERQPLLTLHGHVHESARLTGEWKTRIGRTVCINAAHDGPELALVRFDPESPGAALRELLYP